jgi:hypothetical protein
MPFPGFLIPLNALLAVTEWRNLTQGERLKAIKLKRPKHRVNIFVYNASSSATIRGKGDIELL